MPERSLIPEKYHILSGSALKTIAVICMLIDHTAAALVDPNGAVLVTILGRSLTLFRLMRIIGRIAFPLFAFLLVEGFLHTHDRKKYALRLGIFALVSEIPWDLALCGGITPERQNVFFTLLVGYAGMCVTEAMEKEERSKGKARYALILLGLLVLSIVIPMDFGCAGFGFILMMYLLRKEPLFRAILSCCILPGRWRAGLSAIPIALYNGKRGFVRGKTLQLVFYAIYPVHLLLLYGLRVGWFGF